MTLKVRLIALIAFAVLALSMLGAVAVMSARDSARRLVGLYEIELLPALALNSIHASFQATHSRMLGVALDTYSPTGARHRLAEDRRNIAEQWQNFMAAYGRQPGQIDAEHQRLVEQIDAYLPEVWRLFDEIHQVAASNDAAALTALLEARWPELHMRVVKPVAQLVPLYEGIMRQAYEDGRQAADHEVRIVVTALLVTLLGLLAGMVWIVRRISLGVLTIHDGLERLATNCFDRALPIRGKDEFAHMVAALNSTADRLARSRAEILALKNRNELIIQSMGEGLYGTDTAGNITFINAAGATLTGWRAEELIGKPAHATLHHSHRDGTPVPSVACPLHISLHDGKRHDADDDVFWRRDRTPFDVRIVSTPIVEDGKITGAVVVFADVSAAKQAERELHESYARLREAHLKLEEAQNQLTQSAMLASIGQLAAGMAHEINNPVGFVKSNLGTLERYSDSLLRMLDLYVSAETQLGDPEGLAQIQSLRQALDIDFLKEDLPTLLRECKEGLLRVQRIIHDLKEFSRIDAPEWQQVDLNACLDATLNVLGNEIGSQTEVRRDYALLPQVECHAAQMNQVFMNLLRNAAQALEECPGDRVITLHTGQDEMWIWTEIEDNGKGMSPQVQQRIFEPFFTTRPVGGGTGLGLSIAYGIVRKHGGRIEVDSVLGRGTRMRVLLPRQQEAAGKATESA